MKIHCPFKGCKGVIDLNESLHRFAMGGDARFFINAKDLDHSYKGVEMTAEEHAELMEAIDTELNVFYPDGVTEEDLTKKKIEEWLADFRDQRDEERADSVQDASNRKGFFTCSVCYNVVGSIQLEPGLYNVMCATPTDKGRSVLYDTSDKAHEKHISLSVDKVPDKYLKPWARPWKPPEPKKKCSNCAWRSTNGGRGECESSGHRKRICGHWQREDADYRRTDADPRQEYMKRQLKHAMENPKKDYAEFWAKAKRDLTGKQFKALRKFEKDCKRLELRECSV